MREYKCELSGRVCPYECRLMSNIPVPTKEEQELGLSEEYVSFENRNTMCYKHMQYNRSPRWVVKE